MVLRVGTDCSGIEAPIQALMQLKIPFKHSFSCERDKYAIETILANYEPEVLYDNILTRKHKNLPEIDLYVCGFPCQAFSNLGAKLGTKDPRSIIMFHCIEVIRLKQPKYFILENVRGFVSNNKGKTMELLINSLENAGYNVYYQILNTKDFGLPQNRPRIYFVGIRKDLNQTFEFPEKHIPMKSIDDILIDHTYDKNYKLTCKSTIANLERNIHEPIKKGDNWIVTDAGFGTAMKNISPTLATFCFYYMTKYNRRFFPLECLMLQGFPKNFKCVVSNTQLYKQAGNSMSVPVLKAILKNLLPLHFQHKKK